MIWIFDMLEWCRGFIPNTANTVLCVNTPYAYGSLPEETLTIEHSKCSSIYTLWRIPGKKIKNLSTFQAIDSLKVMSADTGSLSAGEADRRADGYLSGAKVI